jgi:hypothetical protein
MKEAKIASNLEKSFFFFPNKLIQTSASTFLHAFENKLKKTHKDIRPGEDQDFLRVQKRPW